MCKKLMLLIGIVAMLFFSTQATGDVRVWLYGGSTLQNAETKEDISLRLGYVKDQIEIGISSSWYDVAEKPHIFGLYGLYHFDAISIPQPIPVEWLPNDVNATPYFGAAISIDFLSDGRTFGPVAGFIIQDILFTEIQYLSCDGDLADLANSNGEFKWVTGLCYRF